MIFTLSCLAAVELSVRDFSRFSDLDFAERYAYSTNRTELIGELKRETAPWFFYTLLNLQVEGRLDEATALVRRGIRSGCEDGWHALQLRQMFLDWENAQGKPRGTGRTPDEFLAWDLQHPGFGEIAEPHCVREIAAPPNTHPSALDPAKVSFGAFSNRFAHADRYDFLLSSPANDGRYIRAASIRRQPNEPGLLDALMKEFGRNENRYRSFGATADLTIDQLGELRRRGIVVNEDFINDMLKRLGPNAGEDTDADPDAKRRWLDRVLAFVKTLGDDQRARKIRAVADILELERSRGNFAARELFLSYLKLNAEKAGARFVRAEGMVADYLAAYRRAGDDFTAFAKLVGDDALKRIAAETDLLSGVDQAKVDLSGIRDAEFAKLRDRVEINWFAGNPKSFAGDADVALEADVKNVKRLRVAVYELDAFRALTRLGGEIRGDIDLDGCVPTFEETRDYSSFPAIVRHRERLAFPSLGKPGVYVVECSGAGVSSRAVIRKGTLRVSERVESCGHVFTVLDERGTPVRSARLRLGETTFAAGESGEIAVPFADPKSAGPQLAVVGAESLAVAHRFTRRSESYALALDVFLPPEAMVGGRTATAVLTPRLTVADAPASLALLESPQLSVTFTDLHGVSSVRKVDRPRLSDDGECVFPFAVPPQTLSVRFALTGKVRNLSMARDDDVSAVCELQFNGLACERRIEQAFLRHDADGYSIELCGRNGEPLAARELQVLFRHRVFRHELQVALQTDAKGVVRLGALPDIDTVRLAAPFAATWNLAADAGVRLPASLALSEGERVEFRVPGLLAGEWPLAKDVNASLTLVALNAQGAVTRDLTQSVSVRDEVLSVPPLPCGTYRLYLRGIDRTVGIEVAKGVTAPDGARRLRVADARFSDARHVAVRLANANPDARVHLVGRRYVPQAGCAGADLFAMLARAETPSAAACLPNRRPLSSYVSGRDLGDRLRYILDRRNQPHRPGNMLDRPSLLMNPWSVSETRTDGRDERAESGWADAACLSNRRSPPCTERRAGGSACGGYARHRDAPSYDFLADNERVWCNLRPDAKGEVVFDLPDGLDLCDFAVVATDGEATDVRRLAVKSVPAKRRDVRSGAASGDRASVRTRTLADLKSAYELILANGTVEHLDKFAFVTRWPTFAPERQRELYGEFACHELDVFLFHRDPKFFDAVIRPSLRNKRRKDFIDRYLLGDDLSAWTKPSAWRDLNAFERCLLGKRVPGVAGAIAGQLRLWCEAHPLEPEAADRYLRAALGLSDDESSYDVREVACAASGEPDGCDRMEMPLRAPEVLAEAKAWSKTHGSSAGVKARMTTGARMERAAKMRPNVRQTYRPPERTREWVESQYYRRRQGADTRDLAADGRFWRDYAAFTEARDARFLSENFAEMIDAHSLAEALVALAVVSLPFEATEWSPKIVYSERSAKGRDAGTRDLAVVQRIRDVARSTDGRPCYETEEFEVGRIYELVTVVSNPTERRLRLGLSRRIPDGAIALEGGRASACDTRIVEPYASVRDSVLFYFPSSGREVGVLTPASVAVDGEVRGVGAAFACRVVDKSAREDRAGWQWISQNGTDDQVIAFLSSANLESDEVSLGKIGWRMHDDGFARRVYATLSRRGVFSEFLWRFSLCGRSRISDFRDRVRELLMSREIRCRLAPKLGPSFHCSLVDIEPEESDLFEYSEFWPLFNARAHALGGTATIANESLKAQYRKFLDTLATRRTLRAGDRLDAAVYLIAQDRVDEAKRLVADLRSEDVQTKMQLDYLNAYFAFSDLQPEKGRAIAGKYADWPVKRWRERFRTVIAQADEIAGRVSAYAEARSAAAEAPSLELAALSPKGVVEAVVVKSRNAGSCTLRAYRTDVEVAFSKAPFGGASVLPASSLVKPAWETVLRPAADGTATVRLPAALQGANLILEATDGEGRVRTSLNVLSGSLDVRVASEYGELRVRDRNGKPLAAAYVKVYAQDASGSREKFHKDGYTDLRGAFDYASVSSDGEFRPARFAILVLHESEGVKTLTVAHP